MYSLNRSRRRPNPKPYYTPPSSTYGAPSYDDYRGYAESDYYEPNSYVTKSKKKPSTSADPSKDYPVVDTDIGQFYDPSSASYRVPPAPSAYDYPSYYTSGGGSSSGAASSGTGYDGSDMEEYQYSTTKPKIPFKHTTTRPTTTKEPKTRTKYVYASDSDDDESEFRYPSSGSGSSGFGTSGTANDDDDTNSGTYAIAKFNLLSSKPQIYQTAQKTQKSKATKGTTAVPPIKISDQTIDVLTKPIGSATFNLNLSPGVYNSPPAISFNPLAPIQPSYKSVQPPATSYGVPIAPPLNSYSYPYPSASWPSSNFISPSTISITESPVKIPGQFAEPPPLNQQELANVNKNLYSSSQSSYDATPHSGRRPPKRKPTKVNSKRVSTSPPVTLNTDEEYNTEDENNEYIGESYSFFKTMPQPSLPNTYDQEEFNQIGKNKRKLPRPTVTYYENYEREETARTTKRPKSKTKIETELPDEDYLDDLIRIQTTRRPNKKKSSKSTTAHVLDTDDLREAFDSDINSYPPLKPKRNKVRTQFNNDRPSSDYEQIDPDYEETDDEYETNNDRISDVNSQEIEKKKPEKETNVEEATLPPSYWDKSSSIYKQYGIRARNDNFQVSSSFNVGGYTGLRPLLRGEDRFDLYAINRSRAKYLQELHSDNERISSTLRSVTASQPTTLYVWNGKDLPKNHKMT